MNVNFEVLDFIAIQKKKPKSVSGTPARAMIYVQFANTCDATVGMALVGGSLANQEVPAGLRVSFSESSVADERKKYTDDKKNDILDDNHTL